ncbi:hypothetical protein BJF87_12860 [Gordonia sp. CNJ-863]|nr:hypothetical protein BJF87_12860 [Gordonia sp. CNJ-863]
MGPGWQPYRRSVSSTFLANIGIAAVIVGLFLAIRDLWTSDGGEQVWSWLHTLAEDRAAAGTDDGHRDGQMIGESIESDGHLRGE